MEFEYQKRNIINEIFDIKEQINDIEKEISIMKYTSSSSYYIEYNKLVSLLQNLKYKLKLLIKKLYMIDPHDSRLKDLGVYDANNLFNIDASTSVGKRTPKSKPKRKPKSKPKRKPKSKPKRKPKPKSRQNRSKVHRLK
jgi:hypothetical protein